MHSKEVETIERKLVKCTYGEIDAALEPYSSELLADLLDSKSVKIGDSAVSILSSRGYLPALIDALLSGQIRTALGRLRVLTTASSYGLTYPQSIHAYWHCLHDRSIDVLSQALFGIVFLRRYDLIERLAEVKRTSIRDRKKKALFDKAIAALTAKDPSLYVVYYRDAANVWRLNEPPQAGPAV